MHDRVLILDLGSQVTQLTARRMRGAHVYYEIHPNDVSDAFVRDSAPKVVIPSGSHTSTYESHQLRTPQAVWDPDVSVFDICCGMQTTVVQLDGKVEWSDHREFGYAGVRAHGHTCLLKDIWNSAIPENHGMLKVQMSHGDKVVELPPGFKLLASTPSCLIAGMVDEAHGYCTAQSHPEVTHTVQGHVILECFVPETISARSDWVIRDHIDGAVKTIREQADDEGVILELSGGVDSSMATTLIRHTIGDQLTYVFVDHELLRLGEGKMVMDTLADHLYTEVMYVDTSEQFLGHLAGVTDSKAKRKITDRKFVEAFQAEAKKLDNAEWLVQGMIYPDVVKSGGTKTKKVTTVKSRHNVGGLSETFGLKLPEPLRDLFRDEARKLDVALGLPHEVICRHPFPGPGLGMHVLGGVKHEYADLLCRVDAIFVEELRGARATAQDASAGLCGEGDVDKSWYDLTSQAFAVLLPIKSIGVMGDDHTYDCVMAPRTVRVTDFMTAHWAHLPHTLLDHASDCTISEVCGLNRVVYDVSGKPPTTVG